LGKKKEKGGHKRTFAGGAAPPGPVEGQGKEGGNLHKGKKGGGEEKKESYDPKTGTSFSIRRQLTAALRQQDSEQGKEEKGRSRKGEKGKGKKENEMSG